MKRIRTQRPRARRERSWREALPPDPRDPDVVRAKALARAGNPRRQVTSHAVIVPRPADASGFTPSGPVRDGLPEIGPVAPAWTRRARRNRGRQARQAQNQPRPLAALTCADGIHLPGRSYESEEV